jgi:hypothetical protein
MLTQPIQARHTESPSGNVQTDAPFPRRPDQRGYAGDGRRPARAETSAQPAVEPALCIEETIRRFVEEQPAQLYRVGA